MRLQDLPNTIRHRFTRPATWGAVLLFSAVWVLVRLATGIPVATMGLGEVLIPMLMLAGHITLGPLPWQWTGDDQPVAVPWKGCLQALPWNGLWIGLVLLLVQGMLPSRPPRPAHPSPPPTFVEPQPSEPIPQATPEPPARNPLQPVEASQPKPQDPTPIQAQQNQTTPREAAPPPHREWDRFPPDRPDRRPLEPRDRPPRPGPPRHPWDPAEPGDPPRESDASSRALGNRPPAPLGEAPIQRDPPRLEQPVQIVPEPPAPANTVKVTPAKPAPARIQPSQPIQRTEPPPMDPDPLALTREDPEAPHPPQAGPNPPDRRPDFILLVMNLPFAMVLGWILAEKERAESKEDELEELARQARSRALQAQLHPHALYNVLSGLTELVHEDPDAAEEALIQLTELLRMLTRQASATELPLAMERTLLKHYLAIEAIRLGPRLTVEWHWPDWADPISLPPLLIQPLVENAIKHGISPHPDGGILRIGIYRSDRDLIFRIANTGQGLNAGKGEGTGMRNLRERLSLLKEFHPSLELRSDDPWTLVELRLNMGFKP